MGCLGFSRASIAENRCNYALLATGVVLVAIGVGSTFFLDQIVRSFIIDNLIIRPDSATFRLWTHPPADVYLEIYLMNVTNPEKAAIGLEKPHLVNQGPYVFKEIRRKLNSTFHGNGTLSFYEPVFYFYDEKRSRGSLKDRITQLDLVVAGMSHQFSFCNTTKECAATFLSQNFLPALGIDIPHELFDVQRRSIFKTYSVNDFLFNGYIDPFLMKLKSVAKLGGQDLPTRIGLFYGRNGSANGVYTIETGENDIHNYQGVTHFNGESVMKVWRTPYANRIEGTIGHGFRPFLKQGDRVHIFAGDLCRSSELEYDSLSEIDGVTTYLYKPPKDAAKNPNQEGFCVPDINNCPPAGLMDETACFGEPTFMGKPHFFESHDLLGSVFSGLNPNEEEHETIMNIDPYTGAVIDVDKRLMIYFPVRQSFITRAGNIKLAPNVRDNVTTIFPMFWVNETAKVRPVVFDQIRYMVYPAMAFAQYAPFVIGGIGVMLLAVAVIRLVLWKRRQQVKQSRAAVGAEERHPTTEVLNGSNKTAPANRKIEPEKKKERSHKILDPLLGQYEPEKCSL